MTNRIQVKLSELCFYLFFVALLFAKGIGLYDGQTSFKVFLLIALIGWIGKMLLTQYDYREIPLYLALIALGGIIYLISHEKGALIVIMLLCALKGMELKRVFRVGIVTWVLSFGTLFLLTSTHVIDSAFKVHDRLGMGRVIRWSLGYAHPNVLHISYFVLVCFLVYLLQDRFRFWYLLLIEAGNLYVFLYSLSTTGFLVTTGCLMLVLYWNLRKDFCKAERIMIQLCLPVCLFISLGAPLLLRGKAFDLVNKLLNTRLELSKWFLENQPVKLLGVDTRTIVTSLRTMDSSYVFALITYGVIFFIFIILCYFRVIYRNTVQRDGIALCVILSCLIAGLTEPFLFNTSFKNLSLLFIGVDLFCTERTSSKRLFDLKMDRNLQIPFPDVTDICSRIRQSVRKYGIRLMAFSAVGALLSAIVVFCSTPMPERYLLPRKAFEYTDDLEESYYLTSEEDILNEGDRILGYESEQTEMVAFTGNIAQLERFRNTVTGAIVSGLLIFGAGSLLMTFMMRNKNGVRENEK